MTFLRPASDFPTPLFRLFASLMAAVTAVAGPHTFDGQGGAVAAGAGAAVFLAVGMSAGGRGPDRSRRSRAGGWLVLAGAVVTLGFGAAALSLTYLREPVPVAAQAPPPDRAGLLELVAAAGLPVLLVGCAVVLAVRLSGRGAAAKNVRDEHVQHPGGQG